MAPQQLGNGQTDPVLGELAVNALTLFRSIAAVQSFPALGRAVGTLQQATQAAKEDDHDNAVELLKSGLAIPILEFVRKEVPELLRRSIRQALTDRFPELVTQALRDRLSNDVVETVCEDVMRSFVAERQDLAANIAQLTESIQSQTSAISLLTDAGVKQSILSLVAPGFLALIREQESVKTEIGRRVSESFFSNQRRPAFVLASSTAVLFGLQLRRMPTVKGTLFFTNSVAFPLAVLNDRSPHEVGTFWGRNYDDNCGGWLPSVGDEPFFTALGQCFSQGSYALTTAVVTPRKLSAEHGMHFVRPEAARMARCLVESAQDIIMMLPADRICHSLDASEQAGAFPFNADWKILGKRIHLVTSGVGGQHLGQCIQRFTEQGITVHHQPPESTTWHVAPAQ